jgi:hypothetical protein
MIGKIPGQKHGGLNMSSPTPSQICDKDAAPVSPAVTTISSTTNGGSPVAKGPVDPKLESVLQLVDNVYHAQADLDKQNTSITEENNTIVEQQSIIDKAQEAVDKRRYDLSEREKNYKRALEAFEDDMHKLDKKIRRRDDYDDS